MRSCGYHLKKNAELWAPFWKKFAKFLLFNEKCRLPCGIVGMVFNMFVELWVTVFQTWVELWVQILNQNRTSSSKTGQLAFTFDDV